MCNSQKHDYKFVTKPYYFRFMRRIIHNNIIKPAYYAVHINFYVVKFLLSVLAVFRLL